MTEELELNVERESHLNAILLAYIEECQAGHAPDRTRLLEENPNIRDELEQFFADRDEVERLTARLRECEIENKPSSNPHSEFRIPHSNLGQLGDFRLLREIGHGGMGVVYEAEQISLRRRVALKILPFAAALDPRQLQRFKNEALAAAHLRHENIVPVYAVGEERGVHFYAMQFIDGRSLATLIAELKQSTGNDEKNSDSTSPVAMLSTHRSLGNRKYFEWVARMGRQAALALAHAHAVGIVHRDIKPANLLLDPAGQLWITDFGLAQFAGSVGLTATGEVLGTLRYASPEQVLARRGVVDQRSDVYSLGATLYELLTLRPIFEGRDRNELLRQIGDDQPPLPRSIHTSVPRELETIVLKALGKEQSERYVTAHDLADDLQRFVDNQPVLARRPTPMERLHTWARRRPSLVAAGIVVLLLLTAGSLVSALLIRNEQERTKTEQLKTEEAYRRERQRAEEAEARFRLARRTVDEVFRISQEELANRPGLEGLRKRMLFSVLANYQEFLQQRRDDAEAHAELLETKQRVEQILADLAVLRTASQLYLLNQPGVLDDLQLDNQQRPKVMDFCARVGKKWMESLGDVGKMSPSERGRRDIDRARGYEVELNELLTPTQQLRLRQIALQAEGSGAFGEPEVVAELKLTPEQRENIRMIEENALFGWMRPEAQEKPAYDRVIAVLTEDQMLRWKAMTGKPMKFLVVPFGAVKGRGLP